MSENREEDIELMLSCLEENDGELTDLLKKRRYYLRELSVLIAASEDTGSSLSPSESLVEQYNMLLERLEENLPEDRLSDPFMSSYMKHNRDLTLSSLCRMLANGIKGKKLSSSPMPGSSRVCYFRNRFSDDAYLAFSPLLKDATASYTDDFGSACEEVFLGRTDHCIIPFASYSDGLMPRFIGLMQKYELFISLSCRIVSGDGSFTTFVLLSSGPACVKGADRLALTANVGSSCPLQKLLSIASNLGAVTLSCDLLPERLSPSEAYYLIFDVSECGSDALILALTLALPSLTVNGLFKEIKFND